MKWVAECREGHETEHDHRVDYSYCRRDVLEGRGSCGSMVSWREVVEPGYEDFRHKVLCIRNEVSCRVDHGAESGGHLEAVLKSLDELLEVFE